LTRHVKCQQADGILASIQWRWCICNASSGPVRKASDRIRVCLYVRFVTVSIGAAEKKDVALVGTPFRMSRYRKRRPAWMEPFPRHIQSGGTTQLWCSTCSLVTSLVRILESRYFYHIFITPTNRILSFSSLFYI
jgi:hypothetical protein